LLTKQQTVKIVATVRYLLAVAVSAVDDAVVTTDAVAHDP
jgi:hypothetical protein